IESGLVSGWSHPFSGLDHLLAMVAVGLWAAQLGQRAFWSVPLTFVSVMLLGGCLGMAGITLPYLETGIMLSILFLGLLIARSARFPLPICLGLVALFALFHGFAHGLEIPPNASGAAYTLGFIAATATLHLMGMGLGLMTGAFLKGNMLRWAGASIAMAGVLLWLF
ncbi:MAG: HupE/UreJ family protein, partial [Verrucomicrobiae bacterium]|nr:HupE/UreJ family protein [Verrucomicrobiae bacterium]